MCVCVFVTKWEGAQEESLWNDWDCSRATDWISPLCPAVLCAAMCQISSHFRYVRGNVVGIIVRSANYHGNSRNSCAFSPLYSSISISVAPLENLIDIFLHFFLHSILIMERGFLICRARHLFNLVVENTNCCADRMSCRILITQSFRLTNPAVWCVIPPHLSGMKNFNEVGDGHVRISLHLQFILILLFSSIMFPL